MNETLGLWTLSRRHRLGLKRGDSVNLRALFIAHVETAVTVFSDDLIIYNRSLSDAWVNLILGWITHTFRVIDWHSITTAIVKCFFLNSLPLMKDSLFRQRLYKVHFEKDSNWWDWRVKTSHPNAVGKLHQTVSGFSRMMIANPVPGWTPPPPPPLFALF